MRLLVTQQSAAALPFVGKSAGLCAISFGAQISMWQPAASFLGLAEQAQDRKRAEELKEVRTQAKAAARALNILRMMPLWLQLSQVACCH